MEDSDRKPAATSSPAEGTSKPAPAAVVTIQSVAGLAATFLVLVPALVELVMAKGSVSAAIAIAKVLPPTTLGVELLPASVPVILGVGMVAALAYRTGVSPRPSGDEEDRLYIAIAIFGAFLALILSALAQMVQSRSSGTAESVAPVLLAMLGAAAASAFLAHRHLRRRIAKLVNVFLVTAFLFAATVWVSTAQPKVQVDGTGSHTLLTVTEKGVWLLDEGLPRFVMISPQRVGICADVLTGAAAHDECAPAAPDTSESSPAASG